MIYLGNKPVGLLAILPEWAKFGNTELNFNQYQQWDTANMFFSDSYVKSVISNLPAQKYKIIFENNTENTRAGQYIMFTKNNNAEIVNISVMRVGLTQVQGSSYGIDVYENAKGIIYINTKEVTPNA